MKKYLFMPLFISTLFLFVGCEKKKEEVKQEPKKQILEVKVHTMKKQAYPIWVDFSGKTEAFKSVEVISRVNGELKKIFFQAGSQVKKGDILFKIDDSQYKAVLEQKNAAMEKNIASLNLAIANVKRYKPLVEKGLAPREKLDELIASQKQLQATVDADRASIKQAKLDVQYTSVKASIDGQIGKELVDVGNLVGATSTVLANIVDASTLHVNFSPSAKEVSLIKQYKSEKNPSVKVYLEDNENIELQGNIDFIDNTTNVKTGTVQMRAKIDNSKNIVFPGTFVRLKLFISDKIPFLAIHPDMVGQNQLGSFVYVVNTQNKLEKRKIEIDYSNRDFAIAKSGLVEGDRVVVSETTKLKEALEVKALEVENPIKL